VHGTAIERPGFGILGKKDRIMHDKLGEFANDDCDEGFGIIVGGLNPQCAMSLFVERNDVGHGTSNRL